MQSQYYAEWNNHFCAAPKGDFLLVNKCSAKIHEYFSVMVSGNDCKYCNLIESYKTVFLRFQDYFPILRKTCFLTSGLL